MTGIVFLDSDFKPMSAPVDNFTSLIWSSKYYQHGSFSLTLPIERYKHIKSAAYVYNPDNGGCAIFSRLNLTSEKGTVTPSGFLLEALLDRRTITTETKLTGDLETAVRALVTACAITAPRAIARLALDTAVGFTDTVDTSIEIGTRLSDALYAILKPFGMSYTITLNYATGTLLFSLVKGLDRTEAQSTNSRAVFSTDFENLQGIEYLHNEDDFANFAYVTGIDSTLGTVTVEVDQSGTSERREMFVNANVSSKKSDDTDMTLAEYQALLASVGAEALANNKAVDDVSGDIDTNGSLKYRTNYNLGDLCDVIAPEQNLSWVAQITGVDEVYEGGGKRIIPAFGDSATDIVGLIKREAKKNGAFGGSGGSGAVPNSIVITEVDANKRITKVDVSSFTEIYPYQFWNYGRTNGIYRNLVAVVLSSELISIGDYAFYNCAVLVMTSLPAGLLLIPTYAFYGCSKLALTSLPSGITSIGDYAFDGCTDMILTELPSEIKVINYSTFNRCTNIALTSLPNGISSIKYSAFGSCENLALTSLPSELIVVGQLAFNGCIKLAITFLPTGVTNVGASAFRSCTSLEKLWIPLSCISITASSSGTSPFYLCSSALALYCEAESKPTGWGSYWNYCNSTTQLTVNWGVTKEAFDALP